MLFLTDAARTRNCKYRTAIERLPDVQRQWIRILSRNFSYPSHVCNVLHWIVAGEQNAQENCSTIKRDTRGKLQPSTTCTRLFPTSLPRQLTNERNGSAELSRNSCCDCFGQRQNKMRIWEFSKSNERDTMAVRCMNRNRNRRRREMVLDKRTIFEKRT